MSHNVKWCRPEGDDGGAPPDSIALRTEEDATRILLQAVRNIHPDRPPSDFHSRARALSSAISMLTATILRSGAAAVSSGDASSDDIAMSSAFATNMLCKAAADLLTNDVEVLLTEKLNPEFSEN